MHEKLLNMDKEESEEEQVTLTRKASLGKTEQESYPCLMIKSKESN